MPSKRPVKLPKVSTPRDPGLGAPSPRSPTLLASLGEGDPTVRFSNKEDSVPRERARKLAEALDTSFDLPPGLKASLAENDWKVQSPQEILAEVRQRVQELKPWREALDEGLLDAQRQGQSDDRGALIILPDTRIRSVEEDLSRRVRAQLLGEPLSAEPSSATPRKPIAEKKARGPRKVRNPWYLPAKSWYVRQGAKDGVEREGFPYENGAAAPSQMSSEGGDAEWAGEDAVRGSPKDKDAQQVIEEYRLYMKQDKNAGHRLPHFLQ